MALSPFYGQRPRIDPRMLAGIARGRTGMMRGQVDPQATMRRRYDPRREAMMASILQSTGARAPQGIAGTLAQLATAFLAARGLRKQGDLRQGEERRAEEAQRRKADMEAQAEQAKAMEESERRAGRLRGVKTIFQRGTGQELDDDAASVYLENPSLFAGAIKDAQAKPKDDFIRSEVLAMPDGTEVVAHTARQRRELFDQGARPKVAEKPEGMSDEARLKAEAAYRTKWTDISKPFRKRQEGYRTVQQAGTRGTAVSDHALIFAYMKTQDPDSVVRESEFEIAQKLGSMPQRFRAGVEKVLKGERLTPEQRQDIINTSKEIYQTHLQQHQRLRKQYEEIVRDSGFDPERAMLRFYDKALSGKKGAMQGAVTDDDLFAQALGM